MRAYANACAYAYMCVYISRQTMPPSLSEHNVSKVHFLVAECNSIRGFIRLSVHPSIGPSVSMSVRQAFLKNANSSKFTKIQINSRKFTVGRVTAFLDASTHLYKRLCPPVGPLVRWLVTRFRIQGKK